MQSEYLVIGLMSGTSLDGLDIAACKFNFIQGKWSYELMASETIPYSNELVKRLRNANDCSGFELSLLDVDLGRMHGEWVASFMERFDLKPDLIASHGHTVFHRPELGLTLQIGSAAHITAQTGIQTISNFRTIDVALGGQGAPLVPIGDRLLYSEYDACLNLGGIANISFEESGKRIAFDIVPCNMVFNEIARTIIHIENLYKLCFSVSPYCLFIFRQKHFVRQSGRLQQNCGIRSAYDRTRIETSVNTLDLVSICC